MVFKHDGGRTELKRHTAFVEMPIYGLESKMGVLKEILHTIEEENTEYVLGRRGERIVLYVLLYVFKGKEECYYVIYGYISSLYLRC